MNLQDWIECGYTETEANEMLIKFADDAEYEELAHKAYYSNMI